MKEIHQAIETLQTYIQGVWLRRRYIIITAWLVCPVGWFYVYKMPPVYEATARLYVETSTFLEPLLRGLAIRTNPDDQIKLMARTLLARPNLEKIARATDLDVRALNDKDFERLIDSLQKDIKISATGRDDIYAISFSNPEPQVALKVVRETLNTFVENRVGTSRAESQAAERFLSQEIAEYERRLIEAEIKLSDFKKNRLNLLPGSDQNYYGQLTQEKQRLEAARLELSELETRLASARSQIVGEEPVFGIVPFGGGTGIATQFDERIQTLQAQQDALLIRFTENHPDVLETRRLLDSLKAQRDAEIKNLTAAASERPGSGINNNPVYQELRILASRLETETASARVRVKAYQDRVQELEGRLNLIPELEAEFTALNRDYDVNKSKFEALLARRESAELSRRAEASEQNVQFNIIEPPRVPITPSGPNRGLLYSLVLIVGIACGVGVALLRSLISPVLTRASQLQSITGYPIFGVISHVHRAQILQVNRVHLAYFLALTGALVMLYLLLITNEILFGRPAELLMGIIR